MATKDDSKSPLPPYIPFRTFHGFLQKLHDTTVPDQIDKSLFKTYSGSVGRQMTAALKYLGLVDVNGNTNDRLRGLVAAVGTSEWQQILTDVIYDSYHPMLGDINLDTTTSHGLAQKFKAAGADGQMLQKCVGFFVAANRNAGVSLSPHITDKTRKARTDKGKTRAKKAENGFEENSQQDVAFQPSGSVAKFMFPIPEKGTATIFVPSTLETSDWEMINEMMTAYVKRLGRKS